MTWAGRAVVLRAVSPMARFPCSPGRPHLCLSTVISRTAVHRLQRIPAHSVTSRNTVVSHICALNSQGLSTQLTLLPFSKDNPAPVLQATRGPKEEQKTATLWTLTAAFHQAGEPEAKRSHGTTCCAVPPSKVHLQSPGWYIKGKFGTGHSHSVS